MHMIVVVILEYLGPEETLFSFALRYPILPPWDCDSVLLRPQQTQWGASLDFSAGGNLKNRFVVGISDYKLVGVCDNIITPHLKICKNVIIFSPNSVNWQ